MDLKKSPDGRRGYRLRVEYEDAPTIIEAIESWILRSKGQAIDKDVLYAMVQIANDLRNATTAGLDYTGLDVTKVELLTEVLTDYGLNSEFLAGLHAAIDDARVPRHNPASSVSHHERISRAATNMAVYLGVVRELLDAPETDEMDGDLNK